MSAVSGSLKIVSINPEGRELAGLLNGFARKGGHLTAFSDTRLPAARAFLEENPDVDFLEFGRLILLVARALGIPNGMIATHGQVRAAIGVACESLPEESPLFRSSRFRGMHEQVRNVLAELHDWSFSSESLREVAAGAKPYLAAKLESLAQIDEFVGNSLGSLGRCRASEIANACMQAEVTNPLPIQRVMVIAGSDRHPLYVDFCRWLARIGVHVQVVVERVAENPAVFESTSKLLDAFESGALEGGSIGRWYSSLFTDRVAPSDSPSVSILDAPDPLAECEWVIRGCLQLQSAGIWPSRIGICIRNMDQYARLLSSTAARLGVPIKLRIKSPLLANSFAQLCLAILRAIASPTVRPLLRLVGSSYFGLSREVAADCGAAILESAKNQADSWASLETWAVNRTDQGWLNHILQWRRQSILEENSLYEWINRLSALFDVLDLAEHTVAGPKSTKERDLRTQQAMQRALSDIAISYQAAGKPGVSLSTFVGLCHQVWEAEDAIVADSDSGIQVADRPEALFDLEAVFVLGMLEGLFPRRRSENAILNDTDRVEIAKIDPSRPPLVLSTETARAERDVFIRICAAANQQLMLSYPRTDENRDNVPAFYLQELERTLGERVHYISRRRKELVPTEGQGISPGDEAIRVSLEGPRVEPAAPRIESSDLSVIIRQTLDTGVSPGELGLALTCPFWAGFRHRLSIFPGSRIMAWRRLRRLPVVARLGKQPNPESATIALRGAMQDLTDELYQHLEPWELAMLESAGSRLIKEWVSREFAARELWPRDPESISWNVSLDSPDVRNPVNLGEEGEIMLKGSIPGVYQNGDTSVLMFFEPTVPNLGDEVGIESEPDRVEYGLFRSIIGYQSARLAIEVDGMNGSRQLYSLGGAGSLRSDPSRGLRVRSLVSDDGGIDTSSMKKAFFRPIMMSVRSAVRKVKQADLVATPNLKCKVCAYGELCRVSTEFGETGSPSEFEEGEVVE